jgi:HSP20 family protein
MLLRTDTFRDFDRLAARMFDTGGPGLPFDAYRLGDVFTLDFDLPGVDPATIDVTVERNELRIEAERAPRWPDGAQVLMAERPRGKISRRVFISDNLDTDHLTADYEHGVLTVRLPMHEAAKARRVQVGTSGQQKAIEVESK